MNLIINIIIVILSYEFYKIFYNNHIIVILGCSDEIIQNERIATVIDYLKETNKKVTLFITGGIKNNSDKSEASKILKQIENNDYINLNNIEIVYDDKAINTADNFRNLKDWLNKSSINNGLLKNNIVIITSDFHKNRASLIFDGIFKEKINPRWILSKSSCVSCWTDEIYHIHNISNDIKNALMK